MGDTGMIGRIGQALFGGSNKALENQAMAYRRAYQGMTPYMDAARGQLSPYAQQGLGANPLINSLLGIATPGEVSYQAYLDANPDVAAHYETAKNKPHMTRGAGSAYDLNGDGNISPTEWAQYHYETHGKGEGRELPTVGGTEPGTAGAEALTRFRETTGYKDTLNAALGGISTNAAARGLLDSSGTGQIFQRTAADLARSSFGDFFDRLTGQQRVGMEAAGGLADIDLAQASARQQSLFGEHATRGQKKSSFLSKLLG